MREKTLSRAGLHDYVDRYVDQFKVYRHKNEVKARQYLEGLFHEGKHNIERMNERINSSEYQQLQHFISVSPWDHKPVLRSVRQDISRLFEGRPELTGLILDESGHVKSGKKSVGVARQYLGQVGKVDNGQVAVFASLIQGDDVGMVNGRLYLPEEWTSDQERCKEAGIPQAEQVYRTKAVLALEMIREMEGQMRYDWIGGDSIYGNSAELRRGLQAMDQLFVLDIGENQGVYLKHPHPYIAASKLGRGRDRSRYSSDAMSFKIKDLIATLPDEQWKTFTVRKGTKGPLIRQVVVLEVWLWPEREAKRDEVEHLRLIISRNVDKGEIKYSLTNDITLSGRRLSDWGALYRQMQRYWVERGFQDCKDVIGMTDYQVRAWRAWHHHITLTIMALHYMLEQKVLHQEEVPLLSCPDIKLFFALTLPKKASLPHQVWNLIQKRHEQRLADLQRYEN